MSLEKPKNTCAKLSSNIRKLKFMQRRMGEDEKKELEEKKPVITDEHWKLDCPSLEKQNQKFIEIKSFSFCQLYHHGRLSFGGYNKTIEELMTKFNYFQDNAEPYVEFADVSDNEMAKHYLSLEGKIGKRFNQVKNTKKRSINNKEPTNIPSKIRRVHLDKKGFMKPKNY